MTPERSDRVSPELSPSLQLAIVVPSLPVPSARITCGPLSLPEFRWVLRLRSPILTLVQQMSLST